MQEIQSDIVIIGGGLTGLAIAYFLRDKKLKVTIVEARNRLGGRIYTNKEANKASLEMGATWLGKKHTFLIQLLQELNIPIFEQRLGNKAIYEAISTSPHQIVSLPPNSDPSYRIKGGSSNLIQTLAQFIPSDQVYMNQVVKTIEADALGLTVTCEAQCFKAGVVISTLPPYLLTSTIDIKPSLPPALLDVATRTHTWMGESIKVGLRYKKPFWRGANTSGTIVSNVGPIPEMYDHSNEEETFFALKGFLNGAYFSLSKTERLEMVLTQLGKYFGEQVQDFLDYKELVWRNEAYTFHDYNAHILPHENNGHLVYQNAYLDNRLFIGGSETSSHYPGYMEGAVSSAKSICDRLF